MKKAYRIKKEKEFKYIIEAKQSFANRNIIIYISEAPENEHFRIGLSVGKKVGNAVVRNRTKRLFRESIKELRDDILPGYNIVMIARPSIVELSLEDVKKNVQHVFKLANLMK